MLTGIFNLGSYYNSLNTTIKKKDIVIDCLHNFEELTQIVKPMILSCEKVKFDSKVKKDTEYFFKKHIKSYSGNTIELFNDVIKQLLGNETLIHNTIKQEIKDDNVKVVLDYHKLNLIKYVEAIYYFNNFVRQWVTVVVEQTVSNTTPELKNKINKPGIKANLEFVTNQDNIVSFCLCVKLLLTPFPNYLKSIEELKGHLVNPSDWEDPQEKTINKLNPSGFIPVSLNPIYHIGLIANAWINSKHERNKAELTRLTLMLLALRNEQTVETDPNRIEKLEQQINYYSNISNKLTGKIEEMEGK